MAHAVQDHLGHRRLPRRGLAAGLIIDGLSQAIELAGIVEGVEATGPQGWRAGGKVSAIAGPHQQVAGINAIIGQAVRAGPALKPHGEQGGLTVAVDAIGKKGGVMAPGHLKGTGIGHTGLLNEGGFGKAGRSGVGKALSLGVEGDRMGKPTGHIGSTERQPHDRSYGCGSDQRAQICAGSGNEGQNEFILCGEGQCAPL